MSLDMKEGKTVETNEIPTLESEVVVESTDDEAKEGYGTVIFLLWIVAVLCVDL